MAEENQVTIFTDFDKTMVKQNSPVRFLSRLILRHPRRTIDSMVSAFRHYGTGGAGFIQAIAVVDQATRQEVAEMVSEKLTFKSRWVKKFEAFIAKYPLIKNIKIVVITRNISLIPELFVRHKMGELQRMSGGRFRGDIDVIGNDISRIRRGDWRLDGSFHPQMMPMILNSVIDNSNNKNLFIKSENAFYFGDSEEYRALSSHPGLRKLHFYRV